DESARLEQIIGYLLDLAKLDGGGGTLTIELGPVAELFDRVVARHERAAAANNVRIVSAIEPGAEEVRGDRARLEQALQNLAGNAMRYALPGTAIRLGARRAEGKIVISVEDEGPGIPPEHVPHIFDRFYKAEASRAHELQAGTSNASGLGL